jgi:hypothetical protein
MSDLEATSEPTAIFKIIVPATVLGIVFLFPWWYWTAYNHANCTQQHSDIKGFTGLTSCQQLDARANANQTNSESHEPWYGPEWVLCYVGFLYAIFALGQWWAVARQSGIASKQAEILRKQVSLQEIAFQQWLEFEWTIRENTPCQGTRILTFQCLIVNKTEFPLTLDSVSITSVLDQEWLSGTVPNYVIPPRQGYYPVDAIAFLTEAEESKYQGTTGLLVTIRGEATYINCLKQTVTVDFGQLCHCGAKVRTRFILHAGTGQQTKVEKSG